MVGTTVLKSKYISVALGYDTLEEIPHYDTINNFLKNLEVSEVEKIRVLIYT